MKKAYAMLPLVCGIAALQGCQTLHRGAQSAMRVEPVVSIQHGDTTPDGLYKLGRSLQAQNKLDEAAQAFREAIAKDPEQVDAHNALAAVYASQNRFDLAHAELHAILQKNADLAYVQNNLGYTYFLEKDYPSAIGALGKAIALDPGSARAFGNLSLVYQQIGDADKASAASLRAVGLHASATPAKQASAAAPAPEQRTDESRAPLQAAASGAASGATTKRTGAASQPPLVTADGVNLEIANGTRNAALADEVTAMVKLNGFDVDRLSGLRPYTQHRTVILYRDGFYQQALELSRTFPKPPAIVNNTHTRRASDTSDVRLVIGKWTPQALHPQHAAGSH